MIRGLSWKKKVLFDSAAKENSGSTEDDALQNDVSLDRNNSGRYDSLTLLGEALNAFKIEDEEDSTSLSSNSDHPIQNLNEIAQLFEQGVQVRKHRYHLKSYPNTFVGSEAVDFLVGCNIASSRKNAVNIGRALMRAFHLFEHVLQDHDFNDDFLFYQYIAKCDRRTPSIKKKKSTKTLAEIAAIFEKGVPVKDRKYRLKTYPNVFIASEAVDFLLRENLAESRSDAVVLGKRLAKEKNLFQHAAQSRSLPFQDDNLFFEFVKTDKQTTSPETVSTDEDQSDSSFLSSSSSKTNLLNIARAFYKGVGVRDHKWRLRTYKYCFTGSEAVSFLVNSSLAETRRDAVQLGRQVTKEFNLFHHVHGDHELKDDNLFYRFVEDNERRFAHKFQQRDTLRGISQFADDTSQLSITSSNSVSLEEIARRFREEVPVSENRWRLKTYKDTFIGSDAIDFLLESSAASTREDALMLGRILNSDYHLFEHVNQDHDLKDEFLFYRFLTDDSQSSHCKKANEYESESKLDTAKCFEAGVTVKANRYRLRVYKDTFIGSEAIDFLVNSGYTRCRVEAVMIGRALANKFHLFEHVCGDHELQDQHLFYRFVRENQRVSWNKEIKATKEEVEQVSEKELVDESKLTEEQMWERRVNNFETKMRQKRKIRMIGSINRTSIASFTSKQDLISAEFEPKIDSPPRRKKRDTVSLSISKLLSMELSNIHGFESCKDWMVSFRKIDPRYQILNFFNDCAAEGAAKIEENGLDLQRIRELSKYFTPTSFFSVWRPTSMVAIRRMMLGQGVGKGLDIKGKSAKRGKLSGYVPFLQISENRHKAMIRTISKRRTIRIFFNKSCRAGRDRAAEILEETLEQMLETVQVAESILADKGSDEESMKDATESCLSLDMTEPAIVYIDDYAPLCYGLEIPAKLFWEAYIVHADISRAHLSEYDSGRPSHPAFQDMNICSLTTRPPPPIRIHASSGSLGRATPCTPPRAVVWQMAQPHENPMCPFNLLMAYEEYGQVRPVVSDFDCLLVGNRGMNVSKTLPPDQLDLSRWCVSSIETILESPPRPDNWTTRWLELLQDAKRQGFDPSTPPFGFGDPKSYAIMEHAAKRFGANRGGTGAVRHGAECFNYYFPQELDDEFLVISDYLDGPLPWQYMDAEGLQAFLCNKLKYGYTFPLHPKWVLCDPGWKDIYDKMLLSKKPTVKESMNIWYPVDSGLREHIEEIYKKHPNGFVRERRKEKVSAKKVSWKGEIGPGD